MGRTAELCRVEKVEGSMGTPRCSNEASSETPPFTERGTLVAGRRNSWSSPEEQGARAAEWLSLGTAADSGRDALRGANQPIKRRAVGQRCLGTKACIWRRGGLDPQADSLNLNRDPAAELTRFGAPDPATGATRRGSPRLPT
jgi:hypothetical protein